MSDSDLRSRYPQDQDGSGLQVLSEAASILANKRHSTPVLISRPATDTPIAGSLSTASDMSSDPSLNLKITSSPPSLVVDDGSSDHDMSDLSSSSSSLRPEQQFSGFSVAQLMMKRDRSKSSTSLTYRGSPYDHMNDGKRSSDLASAVIESTYANEESDEDQPLDMSIKSKNSIENVAGRSIFSGSPSLHQQLRPSVIQCVPRTSLVTSTPPESNGIQQPTFSYLNYSDQSRSRCQIPKKGESIVESASKLRILSGPADDCELDIDEHFRRSLGNKYPQVLNKQTTEKTDFTEVPEVDDHFKKALGPAWYKLNKSEKDGEGRNSSEISAQTVTS